MKADRFLSALMIGAGIIAFAVLIAASILPPCYMANEFMPGAKCDAAKSAMPEQQAATAPRK